MPGKIDVLASWTLMVSLVLISGQGTDETYKQEQITTEGNAVFATFAGESINLAESWGGARACLIWQEVGVSECFESEAEMDRRIAELENEYVKAEASQRIRRVASSTCSSFLRLYDLTAYRSPVLYLRDRYQWLNLSSYGFNNRTSSYKVGACNSVFADYSNGGGALYPTNLTQAYDQASSMNSGWNNDVSSVYIG